MTEARPILTWLYVPGNRRERFESAIASGAEVVILDWEDSVPAAEKEQARAQSVAWLGERRPSPDSPSVEIRVNASGSPWHDDDLAAVAACRDVASVRLPKAETTEQVAGVAARLAPGATLTCLLESALGVENAFALANAADRVERISLGEADLRADLGVTEDAGLLWARSRVVVAARAAGLAPPAMSVWTDLSDMAGLSASCLVGRGLGLLGRAAIHPRQLQPIRAAFRPEADEITWARGILASMRDGEGVTLDSAGRMVDEAVVRTARRLVALDDAAADRIDSAFHSA